MFSVHTTQEGFKNATITGHCRSVVEDIKVNELKSHDYRDTIVFEKLRFQNVFRPHGDEMPAAFNSCCLKSVFEKLCFRDGLV